MAQVVTNGRMRYLVCWHEVPAGVRERDFDYVEGDERYDARFVFAYGSWHDVWDAQTIHVAPDYRALQVNVSADSPLAGWDRIATESHWFGVVFKMPSQQEASQKGMDADECVIVGRYLA